MRDLSKWLTRFEALYAIKELLNEIEDIVDVVVVEGARDAEALIHLGFPGEVEIRSHIREGDSDFVRRISVKHNRVLVLTDFDAEGMRLSRRLSKLFESESMVVERELRNRIGRLMSVLGVRAIEVLDNLVENSFSNGNYKNR